MAEVKEQPFRLYQDDPVISVADGTANQWSDIWNYEVPIGVALILKPEHTFAAYLYESTNSAACGDSDCRVKIERRDNSESDVLLVFGPDFYVTVQEFQNKSLMARLKVPAEGVVVNEREKLVISVYDNGAIDESACYFELHIAKIRKVLKA